MATFTDFEETRRQLIETHNKIDTAWSTFISARSPVDTASPDTDDPVRHELREAEVRLNRALIEVGIFGDINRGKSTLLNALLGVEVSSTDVTPETAVPVYVEGGERSALVLFDDGSSEEVPPEDAIAMASQRYRDRQKEKHKEQQPPAVVRVIQRANADLLRQGVRLIDTPGLSDPSMSSVFEDLTLAELDRTAAAIIVFLYPPGIAHNEVELLKSLDLRRVDKTFLVCNFYSGPWEDEEVRKKVEAGITQHIRLATNGETDESSLRLYSVNAGHAWKARRSGDAESFEASGVARLSRDLESYLTDGALSLLSKSAGEHLRLARSIASARITDRIDLLDDPDRLIQVKLDRSGVVDAARARAETICERVERECEILGSNMAELAKEPFENALAELAAATKKRDLEMLEARWRIRVETMISRVGSLFTTGLSDVRVSAQRELVETFEVDHPDLEAGDSLAMLSSDSFGLNIGTVVSTDWGSIALASGAGALLAGSIAGGAGMALLWFMGPVGWAVGAGIGALLAGGGTASAQKYILPKDVLQRATSEIQGAKVKAQEEARKLAHNASADLCAHIRQLENSFSADALGELQAVERFIKDPSEVNRQRNAADALRQQLAYLNL